MTIRRRNPSFTRDDLLDVWPAVARWVAGASFVGGVDWTRLLAAHEATFARLRRSGPVVAYRAAHGRPDEFQHPSAWTLDRALAVSLAQDSLRFGPVTDVRVLLTATFAPEDVWFVLPDLQREADGVGAQIVLDPQEWDEVVVKTGAYRMTAADKRALAASKAAWRTINKLKTATDKRNAALAVSCELYAVDAPVRNPAPEGVVIEERPLGKGDLLLVAKAHGKPIAQMSVEELRVSGVLTVAKMQRELRGACVVDYGRATDYAGKPLRVFAVGIVGIMDDRFLRLGLGTELYARAAEWAAQRDGVLVSTRCYLGTSGTSDMALRVWRGRGLAKRTKVFGEVAWAGGGEPI